MPDDTMFEEAIIAINNGEKERARDLITRSIKANPTRADYWVWMSVAVDTSKERVYCLQEALKIDPANESARLGLTMLSSQPSGISLPPVKPLVRRSWQVVLPETVKKAAKPVKAQTRDKKVYYFAGAALFIIVLIGIGVVLMSGKQNQAATVSVRPPALGTAKPSATLIITNPVSYYADTAVPGGPTPLWVYLAETYTPTPIYVNTPHPRSEAYRAGITAYEEGDWQGLMGFMQQVIVTEPGAPDGYYYLGEAYRMLGQYKEAIEQYDQAIKTNSQFAPAYLGRARVHEAQDSSDDAKKDLEVAINLDPGLAEAGYERAVLAISDNDPQTALGILDNLIATNPNSALVYLYRAKADLAMGNSEQALADAKMANGIDMTVLETYLILGEAYQASGQLPDSLGPLETYTNYVSDDAHAWVMLGKAYAADGQVDRALTSFTAALALDDRNFEVYYQRGMMYIAQGDGQAAMDDMEAATELDDKSFSAGMGLGRAWLLLNYPGEAYMQFQHIQGLAETDSDLAQLYYWRAISLEQQDEMEVALKDWTALAALPQGVVPADWLAEAAKRLVPTATATSNVTQTPTIPAAGSVTPTPKSSGTVTPPTGSTTPNPASSQTPTTGPA